MGESEAGEAADVWRVRRLPATISTRVTLGRLYTDLRASPPIEKALVRHVSGKARAVFRERLLERRVAVLEGEAHTAVLGVLEHVHDARRGRQVPAVR